MHGSDEYMDIFLSPPPTIPLYFSLLVSPYSLFFSLFKEVYKWADDIRHLTLLC